MEAQWDGEQLLKLAFVESKPTNPHRTTSLSRAVVDHLDGSPQQFHDIALYLDDVSPFARSVYEAARTIPPGQTSSYGELAKLMGKPGAARAVGTALGKNPFLLIVPCHRVLAAGGRLGGFSALGGTATKEAILAAEGVGVESLWDEGELEKGRQLLRACPRLGPVVEEVGACSLEPLYPNSPFGALARSVLYQQLATGAARAIEARVKALGSTQFPTAGEILGLTEESLRTAGVSGPKIATLKRLAEASYRGELQPDLLRFLPNNQVVREVSSLKGLGAWTAQMFLMFHLGRRDILPVKDLGIRKGIQRLFHLPDLPDPTFMERKARAWRPYRSLASWYLWRSLEL
jgi:methylated-DNA-[protein]-cysteine S-methyltransferase